VSLSKHFEKQNSTISKKGNPMKNMHLAKSTFILALFFYIAAQGSTITITNEGQFESEILKKPNLAVVKAGAKWCTYCVQSEGPFRSLSNDASLNNIIFATLDVDVNPTLAQRYGANRLPTVLFFKNGKLIDKQEGYSETLRSDIVKMAGESAQAAPPVAKVIPAAVAAAQESAQETMQPSSEIPTPQDIESTQEKPVACNSQVQDFFSRAFQSVRDFLTNAVDTVRSWFK